MPVFPPDNNELLKHLGLLMFSAAKDVGAIPPRGSRTRSEVRQLLTGISRVLAHVLHQLKYLSTEGEAIFTPEQLTKQIHIPSLSERSELSAELVHQLIHLVFQAIYVSGNFKEPRAIGGIDDCLLQIVDVNTIRVIPDAIWTRA